MTKIFCDLELCAFNENEICQASHIDMGFETDWSEGCRTWDSLEYKPICESHTVPYVNMSDTSTVVERKEDDTYKYFDRDEYLKAAKERLLKEAYRCPDCNALFFRNDYDDYADIWDHSDETGHKLDQEWIDKWTKDNES